MIVDFGGLGDLDVGLWSLVLGLWSLGCGFGELGFGYWKLKRRIFNRSGLAKDGVSCSLNPDALGWLKSPPSLIPKPLGAILNKHLINIVVRLKSGLN